MPSYSQLPSSHSQQAPRDTSQNIYTIFEAEQTKKKKKKKMPFQNTDFSTMEYFLTRDFSVGSIQFLKRLTELPLAF